MSKFDWGVDTNQLEQEEKQKLEDQKKFGAVTSGIYNAVIEKAFLSKSDSGATAFEIEAKSFLDDGSEGKTIFAQFWIKSGDEKGNKTTYTTKDGKERLLPAWTQVNHLLAVAGKKLEDLNPKDATIQRGDTTIKVKALEELTGTKTKIVIQQYENEYDNEISIRYKIRDFLNLDGTDIHGKEDAEERWKKTLEKTPVRKLRNTSTQSSESKEEAKAATSGW